MLCSLQRQADGSSALSCPNNGFSYFGEGGGRLVVNNTPNPAAGGAVFGLDAVNVVGC